MKTTRVNQKIMTNIVPKMSNRLCLLSRYKKENSTIIMYTKRTINTRQPGCTQRVKKQLFFYTIHIYYRKYETMLYETMYALLCLPRCCAIDISISILSYQYSHFLLFSQNNWVAFELRISRENKMGLCL